MTTWADLRNRVREITQDNVAGSEQVTDAALLSYANYGLDLIATRHPLLSRSTVTLTNQLGTLPADFLYVQSAHTDGSDLDESFGFHPDSSEFSIISSTELKVGDDSLDDIEIIYLGGYTKLSLDADLLPVSSWLEEPLLYLTVSRTLAQLAVDSGDLSQFDTTIDSGNPEHNPLLRVAEYYEKLADRIMNRWQQR